jgi:hypothetical protein
MSFTQDELQAFNTILEQKLAEHRRELELSLDQRMNVLKQEFERYLAVAQQELLHNLPSMLPYQQNGLNAAAGGEYQEMQHAHVIEEVEQGDAGIAEIQAEVSWEDLMDVIDKVVSDRLVALEGSIQSMVRTAERSLLTQLHSVQESLAQSRPHSTDMTTTNGNDLQDVFTNVEQLEHIIEALQVAMTANHTLLSNRLYHHQHQPLERAHPIVQPLSEDDGVNGNPE